MDIDGKLFFAPGFEFDRLLDANDTQLMKAWLSRIEYYYIKPANILVNSGDPDFGFAAMLLSMSAIEAMAKVKFVADPGGTRSKFDLFAHIHLNVPNNFLKGSSGLYNIFRCGLAHEGRVKTTCSINLKGPAFGKNSRHFVSIGLKGLFTEHLNMDKIGSAFSERIDASKVRTVFADTLTLAA
ncbi:MAG: hypothetical protein ABL958_08015 [Bdellovibrionia bacterium]